MPDTCRRIQEQRWKGWEIWDFVTEGHSYLVVDTPNETRSCSDLITFLEKPCRSNKVVYARVSDDAGALVLGLLSLGLIN